MKLIKTAIDFVDNDQDVVFLGDWCLKDHADILRSIDKYNKVPYHWDDREKYARDYGYLTEVYEENLSQLCQLLNTIHSTDYNVSYWRIVIGPWLRYFTDALFDRYECIKSAVSLGVITETTVTSYDLNDVCPADFSEFWNDFTTDEWNEIVFSECLKYLNIPWRFIDENLFTGTRCQSNKLNLKIFVKQKIGSLLNIYSKFIFKLRSGPVIVGAYAPFSKITKLNLRLKTLPYFFKPKINFSSSERDFFLRKKLSVKEVSSQEFEGLLAGLIPLFIPKCYLEDFRKLEKNALKTLPKNPMSILTANSYQADEVFKVWAAKHVSQGVPLVIGQHGGTFGMASINQSEEHQIKIATKYSAWGWADGKSSKVIDLPSIQLSGRKRISSDSSSNLAILHVMSSLPRYFYQYFSMPVAGQFLFYMKNQISFIGALDRDLRDNVKIRLDLSSVSQGWNIPKILAVAGYDKLIEHSKDPILSLLHDVRLCVCTHNATVFIETLSLNFPTIIFWEPSHHEIRPEAVPFFEILEDAEILFYTPEGAAKKVNNISNDIDEWWSSDQVQSARKEFCQRYAGVSNDWAHEWSDFLLKLK